MVGEVLDVIEANQSHAAGKDKRPFTKTVGAHRAHVHRKHRRSQISTECPYRNDDQGPDEVRHPSPCHEPSIASDGFDTGVEVSW
jgi:hypothetical protein